MLSREKQNRYHRRHFAVLSTKIRRSKALAFRGLCYEKGKTVNSILKEYVDECLNNDRVLNIRDFAR